MKAAGIKEIARQVEEIAETALIGREGCATLIDNEIVLCARNEPGYIITGVRIDGDPPRMLLSVVINVINRMIFDLSPEAASAILRSTRPAGVGIHRRKKDQSTHTS